MSTLRVDNLRGQTADGTNRYVVQVVSETITAQLNGSVGSAGTYIDTGITATITPTSTSNTILVSFTIGATGSNSTSDAVFRLVRGSTNIAQGSSGTYTGTVAVRTLNAELSSTPSITHLDSPATTSATTYKVQGTLTGSGTLAINRRQADTAFGTVSSITLMEIAQ
tara:strand:- start:740 stop:1240 length:501 start_codon:yes stop_codon:yes gene_type:complete